MRQQPKMRSVDMMAKYGEFAELRRRADAGQPIDLAGVFERAVTDFRSVKRNTGHRQILQWCVDEGLDFEARAGWLNQPVACLAAMYANRDVVAAMARRGFPDNPFIRASVGDIQFLTDYASRYELSTLIDGNGFNLLFYCAGSALGRDDPCMKARLADVCRYLLQKEVCPSHTADGPLPIFPAFLCAVYGGNEDVMRQLLGRGGLSAERFHQTIEHALEPHQRSGEPFYHMAELVLAQGFDVDWPRPDQRRTLLHAAANRGTIKAVAWLLQHGANPNVQDTNGRTPLHVCAERNTFVSVARLLVAAGADISARDAAGKTPRDYACQNGRSKVAAYLASIGGA